MGLLRFVWMWEEHRWRPGREYLCKGRGELMRVAGGRGEERGLGGGVGGESVLCHMPTFASSPPFGPELGMEVRYNSTV